MEGNQTKNLIRTIVKLFFKSFQHDDDYGVDDGNELVFPVEQSQYLILEPPKEKPPPPPCDLEEPQSLQNIDNNFKRINSTKRIKKEIRNKRSSFLGIEGNDDFSLELSVAPPPDMAALLMEEKRLEKEMYQKVGLYQNSDNGRILISFLVKFLINNFEYFRRKSRFLLLI